ncbi:hypothetical protein Gorai_008366 [Gossypium raimondii]|uniref:Uncharacterized protein n=1 Tax=Gossypium raimondii TaxID=29730 RepID=A0A7J8QBG9_GOSRA|nr:hypothetical protein [Gossypium raimondii]
MQIRKDCPQFLQRSSSWHKKPKKIAQNPKIMRAVRLQFLTWEGPLVSSNFVP